MNTEETYENIYRAYGIVNAVMFETEANDGIDGIWYALQVTKDTLWDEVCRFRKALDYEVQEVSA